MRDALVVLAHKDLALPPGGAPLDRSGARPAARRVVLMPSERAIRIEAGGVRLYAILAGTPTASLVWEALPLEGRARLHGREIRFDVDLSCAREPGARAEVHTGDLGLWPEGPAVALFFGPSLRSTSPDPMAASPVNVFGRITGDATRLARVNEGDRVRLTALSD